MFKLNPRTIICIVGPTGVGKTRTAILLAKKINGEIVSCDSMQIYREMNIGTAKPTKAEQKQIPHHMIDICSVSQSYSVYQYQKKALKVISEIIQRKKIPIVVGGTGLYLKALLEGLDELPKADENFRKKAKKEIEKYGLEKLYKRLQKIEPVKAGKIKPGDEKRIIRALEVSALSKSFEPAALRTKSIADLGLTPVIFGLKKERKQLYQIIEQRVDRMMKQGLAREVKRVFEGKVSKTARHALGYKEFLFLKEKGNTRQQTEKMREAVVLIKRNSRRYAKRQYTWFNRTKNICWIECGDKNTSAELVVQMLTLLKEHSTRTAAV